MAMNMSGRGGSRSAGRMSGSTNWTGSSSTSKRTNTGSTIATGKHRSCCTSFEMKINSFKTLCNQTRGPAKCGRPTPTTLNSFANWINKGAIVQTCTSAQIARWSKATKFNFNSRTPSVTACKNILSAKFGKATIKAVAFTKSGSFMVVTSPTCKGRNFCFPS